MSDGTAPGRLYRQAARYSKADVLEVVPGVVATARGSQLRNRKPVPAFSLLAGEFVFWTTEQNNTAKRS
jgi:hypothetical protein